MRKLSAILEDTENWLYEEGEDQAKQIYVDKLQELKVNFLKSMLVLNRTLSCPKNYGVRAQCMCLINKYIRNY